MYKSVQFLLAAIGFVANGLYVSAQAQDFYRSNAPQPLQINSQSGDLFMQEESQKPKPNLRQNPRVNIINSSTTPRQEIRDVHGDSFMDETTESAPAAPKARVPIDLRGAGVQVDNQGSIVPLINRHGGPVQQQYNSGIQAYQEMPVPTIAPSYGNPYGALGTSFVPVTPGTVPGVRSMNMPYGYYPAGASPFGQPTIGLSPYGYPGFSPYGFGVPAYYRGYGMPGYGIPGYGMPGYGTGMTIGLPTQTQYSGTYSQTSLTGPSSSLIMPMFQNDGF